MYKNNILKNNKKGASLIIVFFILTIILAIVLNISILLFNQIKIIRNIGNSVVAFYAADSGVEKVLYYDRIEIPVGATRGICNICNVCLQEDCNDCLLTGNDCDPETCSDCNITFNTAIDAKRSFEADVSVSQQCKISSGIISSFGFYEDVSRAIRLDATTKASTLNILSSGAEATAQGQTGLNMIISAEILDLEGVGIQVVLAAITGLGEENGNICEPVCDDSGGSCCTYREIELINVDGSTYSKPWNYGLQGVNYTINIMAIDNDDYCAEVQNITINYE